MREVLVCYNSQPLESDGAMLASLLTALTQLYTQSMGKSQTNSTLVNALKKVSDVI